MRLFLFLVVVSFLSRASSKKRKDEFSERVHSIKTGAGKVTWIQTSLSQKTLYFKTKVGKGQEDVDKKVGSRNWNWNCQKIPPTLTKVGKGQVNNGTKADKKAGTEKVEFCKHLSPKIFFFHKAKVDNKALFLVDSKNGQENNKAKVDKKPVKGEVVKNKDMYWQIKPN